MARKKAEVTEVIEEVKETTPEVVVEDTPSVTVETPIADNVTVAEPVVEKATEEEIVSIKEPEIETPVDAPADIIVPEVAVEGVKHTSKSTKTSKKSETKVTTGNGEFSVVVVTTLYVVKVPGNLATKIGNYKKGTKLTITEEIKGWGKVADGKWINLNYVEKI